MIRPYRPADREALYRICLLTGDSGEDASALYRDPDLLGQVYVGPYLELEPSLAFVLADADGPAGYVLGVRDTPGFEKQAEADWWPPLQQRYPAPDPARRAGWTSDERLAHLIHRPPRTPIDVIAGFPSHLHIDLLPRVQGAGHGRRLMETLFAALRRHGSPGVHLGVGRGNRRAVAFYRHIGFTELSSGPNALVLGLRFG